LVLLALSASAAAGGNRAALSTVGATQACLESLPDAIAGLPPATPPATRALFVDRLPATSYPVSVHDRLGAWQGRKGTYEGVTISFFPTAQKARISREQLVSLEGGDLVANAVVAWDQKAAPSTGLRQAVLTCLRATATSPPANPVVPAASLATFA